VEQLLGLAPFPYQPLVVGVFQFLCYQGKVTFRAVEVSMFAYSWPKRLAKRAPGLMHLFSRSHNEATFQPTRLTPKLSCVARLPARLGTLQ